jgi:hypothetical protein
MNINSELTVSKERNVGYTSKNYVNKFGVLGFV